MSRYNATLVRGASYHLPAKGMNFINGKPKFIDEKTKTYLEVHAIDEIRSTDGEKLFRPKFEFKIFDENTEVVGDEPEESNKSDGESGGPNGSVNAGVRTRSRER